MILYKRIIDSSVNFIIDFKWLSIAFSSLNSSGLKLEEFNDKNAMMRAGFIGKQEFNDQ